MKLQSFVFSAFGTDFFPAQKKAQNYIHSFKTLKCWEMQRVITIKGFHVVIQNIALVKKA